MAIGLVVVVGLQMLWPVERSLPGAMVGRADVGNRPYHEVVEALRQSYANQPLELSLPSGEVLAVSTAEAGLTPHYDQAARAVTDYSLAARLVPFSFVYKMTVNSVGIGFDIEAERLDALRQKVATWCDRAPVDAHLEYRQGAMGLSESRYGRSCSMDALKRSLKAIDITGDRLVAAIEPDRLTPARDDQAMASQRAAAQAVIDEGLRLGTPERIWRVEPAILAGWLEVEGQDDEMRLAIDDKALKAYLGGLKSSLVIQPGVTTVKYLDGIEAGRDVGQPGRLVDYGATKQRIEAVIFGKTEDSLAWVDFSPVQPEVKLIRDYSRSEEGVQALLEQWQRDNAGRYGIIVRDLSGRGLNGQVNPAMDFVTASTYKMFLAYSTLHFMEQGELSSGDRTSTGLTVGACIDEMILHSTNECALALMDLVGWSRVHHFVRQQFPNTSLDNGASADGEKHTTVRDETAFLQRLAGGQLNMSPEHHDYLLGLMKRQIYRDGIPAGVPGVTVADKVGFYAGYKHDVAIIYGDKGPYILAILSYGGADWRFADLSRRVHDLLD